MSEVGPRVPIYGDQRRLTTVLELEELEEDVEQVEEVMQDVEQVEGVEQEVEH